MIQQKNGIGLFFTKNDLGSFLIKNDPGSSLTKNDLDTLKIFISKSTRATQNAPTGKYTFYGMCLRANIRSME